MRGNMLTRFEQDLLNFRRKYDNFDDFFSNYQTEKLKKEENKPSVKCKYVDIPEHIKNNRQISRYVGRITRKNGNIEYIFWERKDHITKSGKVINRWTNVTEEWPEWVSEWATKRVKEHTWDLK